MVKLPVRFKQKLEFIANHHGVAMYELIVQQMGDFVAREYKVLLTEELKRMNAEE